MSLVSRKVGNLVECEVFAVLNVMFCGEMFREIVCVVIFTEEPLYSNGAVVDFIAEPEESHVHAFGFAWFHAVREESVTDFVVSDDGGRGLRMVETMENVSYGDEVTDIGEKGGEFGFCGRGEDVR